MRLATGNLEVFVTSQLLPAERRDPALRGPNTPLSRRAGALRSVVAGLSLILAICLNLIAQTGLAATKDPAAGARKTFHDAQIRYQKEPRDSQAAWQFARACFDLADLATNSAQRVEIAEQGIAACKQLLSRDPNSAPGHYYLGMNLGQVAQTRGLGALKLVTEMEREFSTARDLDSSFDYAGPDRNLGLLYRDAPAMVSIGSR